MIKSIYSQSLESKNLSAKKGLSHSNVRMPMQVPTISQGLANYSTDNLKANFMPMFGANISFHGAEASNKLIVVDKDGTEIPWIIPEGKARVNVSELSKEARYSGDYWGEFADDLAVLLKSDMSIKLKHSPDFDPEIFVHSFANHFSTKTANHGVDTKVILLHDTEEATKEVIDRDYFAKAQKKGKLDLRVTPEIALKDVRRMSPLDLLLDISKEGSKRNVVFVKDYNYLETVAANSKFGSLSNFLYARCPNVSVVGLSVEAKKQSPKEISAAQKALKAMGLEIVENPKVASDVTEMKIPEMGTGAVKEFLKKNPRIKDEVLETFMLDADVKVSPAALDGIVEKAAQVMDGDVLAGTLRLLGMQAAAKITETGSDGKYNELLIDAPFAKKFFIDHSGLLDMYKSEETRFNIAENVTNTLKDVGGIGSVKQDIQDDIIAYLKNPKKFLAERGTAPKGILLEGPPGTGKTLLARAIAGETSTPFISASGSEFVEMYVGVGASRVRELFAKAKKAAENSSNKTAIVFIDEFDALAKARAAGGSGGAQEHEQTLNQFLIELDGFNNKESKTKIIVIAATNRKDMLDPAAIRSGRFDNTFKIDNPKTNAERLEIIQIHAKKLKFQNEAEKAAILYQTAKMTDDMSGAEIEEVMKKAQKVVSKRADNKVVTHNDVVEGLLQVLAGPIQKNGEERPLDDIVKTVRHEGGHATAIDFLKPLFNEKISFITLDPRGDFLGAVFHHSPKVNPDFKSVILSAAVSYAGGLAEPGFDSKGRAAGARQDLNNATTLFRRAVTEWGQGIFTPPYALAPVDGGTENAAAQAFYNTMQNANQKNILKDVNLLSTTSERIAKMINEFHAGFLDSYVEKFKANTGKGGNNLSGEEFRRMRRAWLVETGKVKAEKDLLRKVTNLLDEAYNANKGLISRTIKKVAMAVR